MDTDTGSQLSQRSDPVHTGDAFRANYTKALPPGVVSNATNMSSIRLPAPAPAPAPADTQTIAAASIISTARSNKIDKSAEDCITEFSKDPKNPQQEKPDNTIAQAISVTYSVLSEAIGKLGEEFYTTGRHYSNTNKIKNVLNTIAEVTFNMNRTDINMRDTLEPASTEAQMASAWGINLTKTAKTNKRCWEKKKEEGDLVNYCYLCGGPIVGEKVNNRYPAEMEHKLPCGDFYSKFQFVKSEFPGEYIQWQKFISNINQNGLWNIYLQINNPTAFQTKSDQKYSGYISSVLILNSENIVNNFINSAEIDKKSLPEAFTASLKSSLLEFAYSHHTCNQIKINYNLGDKTEIKNFYDRLQIQLDKAGKESGGQKTGFVNSDILNNERPFIMQGLGNGYSNIPYRKIFVEAQMSAINSMFDKYATSLELTQKRTFIRSIYSAVKAVKINVSAGGNLSKKKEKEFKRQIKIFLKTINSLSKLQKDLNSIFEKCESLKVTDRTRIKLANLFILNEIMDSTFQIYQNNSKLVEDSKFFIELLNEHTISPFTPSSFTAPLTNISRGFENIISLINNKLEDIIPKDGEKEVKDEKIKIQEKKRNFFDFHSSDYNIWSIELGGIIRDIGKTGMTPAFQDIDLEQAEGAAKAKAEGKAEGTAKAEGKAEAEGKSEAEGMDVEDNEATDVTTRGKTSSPYQHPDAKKKVKSASAGDTIGGSRRRIKKRRPSRTRRNKSNLKSKSKTKTRKQKKPKLKRKSKKRKGSSRRSRR